MRDFVSRKAREIPPSGIRRFFELALTMDEVISLGVGEPDFSTPGISARQAFTRLNRAAHHTPLTGA